MFFSALFCTKILTRIKKILIINQRSNGDVYLLQSLISILKENYANAEIEILVNDDTHQIAKLLQGPKNIITFSYEEKHKLGFKYVLNFARSIFKKFDLTINLAASDRSVIFAILSAKRSISIVERALKKSWWKRALLSDYYEYTADKNILDDILNPLSFLKINHLEHVLPIKNQRSYEDFVLKKFNLNRKYIIFHPCAQYNYKVYPEHLRSELINYLLKLNLEIVVTGGNSILDLGIKETIPKDKKILNLIGETSFKEFISISNNSMGYVGMDTVNMHIAASQNKEIFAIFGPTNTKKWAPFSTKDINYIINSEKDFSSKSNVHIFQSDMKCMPCGKAGCDDNHGESYCLYKISPETIYLSIKKCFSKI